MSAFHDALRAVITEHIGQHPDNADEEWADCLDFDDYHVCIEIDIAPQIQDA